ncbi:putative ubiquitin-conjugating enzyme E2 W [Grifola frondosa]|uniref:Putative ubiquitin-conjugating enzyme E2 W n=1 Tax=Grifola frondosa TaxID=5627 RepID=A0A1C7MXY6_GRIFR|nr:putative ubiquitin-conjugating enzyme E2 W [Grifola frondosa]
MAKELADIHKHGTPVGIKLLSADDFQTWYLSVEVLGDSIYQCEVFALKFRFDNQYPISSPAVQFVVDNKYQAPIHPHVYSNGHICASILGNEWSPVLSVVAVCVTIQSMLASCKVREEGAVCIWRHSPPSTRSNECPDLQTTIVTYSMHPRIRRRHDGTSMNLISVNTSV